MRAITPSCTSAKGLVRCMPDDFTAQLAGLMQQYNEDVQRGIESAVTAIGKEAAAQLKTASPRRTGKYAKGWRVQTQSQNGEISVTVSNRQYQLTHLLEHGHRTRNKRGFVPAQPHIADVQAWAEQEALRRIAEVMQNDT